MARNPGMHVEIPVSIYTNIDSLNTFYTLLFFLQIYDTAVSFADRNVSKIQDYLPDLSTSQEIHRQCGDPKVIFVFC